MSATAVALLGYIAWMLVLLIGLEAMRTLAVIRDKRSPGSFQLDGKDVSPFVHRLTRAHANCYEHFPIFGGLLILALGTGQAAITDPLAIWLLGARIAQSVVHLISITDGAVQIRFVCFLIQLVIAVWWVIGFVGPLLSAV